MVTLKLLLLAQTGTVLIKVKADFKIHLCKAQFENDPNQSRKNAPAIRAVTIQKPSPVSFYNEEAFRRSLRGYFIILLLLESLMKKIREAIKGQRLRELRQACFSTP